MYKVSSDKSVGIVTLNMFATLPEAFCLPLYIGQLAQVFIVVPSLVLAHNRHYNRQVLDFLDVEVK